jgi:hypothetical protein
MANRVARPWRVLRGIILSTAALTAFAVALGGPAAQAAPKGEWAVFADCPTANPELSGCLVSRVEGGEITLGNSTVPIKNTQTLQGGFTENEETGEQHFVGAADGNTLSKTPQPVPGGLAGLIKCNEITNLVLRLSCELVFQNGLTGVNATTELAGPASSIGLNENHLLGESGTALSLPIKVKLENPFLGSGCYIGSNASPLTLNLTTGTTAPPAPNKPIKGTLGSVTTRTEGRILVISGTHLVDNAFAAPGVNGCGGLLSAVLDPLIDAKLGLPAAAGKNTAILIGTEEQTGIEAARESE